MSFIKIKAILFFIILLLLVSTQSHARIILMDYSEITYVSSSVKNKYLKSLCAYLGEQNLYPCPSDLLRMDKDQFKAYWNKFNNKINHLCTDASKEPICKKIENVRSATLFSGRAHR